MQSGCVLVRNRQFLRHRTHASLSSTTHSTTPSQLASSLPNVEVAFWSIVIVVFIEYIAVAYTAVIPSTVAKYIVASV